MGVAVKKLTWDDIKDLPEGFGRTEIVDGELVVTPTAGSRHQRICTLLGVELTLHVRSEGLGVVFSSPMHVILEEHTHYEPDLCFVARTRRSIIKESFIEGPPDLIIEVISESNRTHDTVVKFRDYARFGVAEYWLVDPRENLISSWRLEGNRYELIGRAALGDEVMSRILPGLRLDAGRVFALDSSLAALRSPRRGDCLSENSRVGMTSPLCGEGQAGAPCLLETRTSACPTLARPSASAFPRCISC